MDSTYYVIFNAEGKFLDSINMSQKGAVDIDLTSTSGFVFFDLIFDITSLLFSFDQISITQYSTIRVPI